MAHIHKVYDTDTHFMLDPVKKELKIGEGYEKVKVIQHDHNSERFTFELPRYIEGHDMSICNKVEVHYLNVDTQTKEESRGVYSVDDLQISPEDRDKVICSWLISHNATKYVGSLFFVLRFECNTGDTIDYVLNTLIYEGIYVGKGIYNSETVITEYADVLEAWRLEIFGAKDGVIKFIEEETQKVINTIPEDYTETVKKVDRIYNNVANAIKGKVSGSVVAVDDVSSVEHKPIVNVHGKNHWDNSVITVQNESPNYPYISEVGSNYISITTPNGYSGNGHCVTPLKLSDICPQMKVGKIYTLQATSEAWNKMIYLKELDKFWNYGTMLEITEEILACTIGLYGSNTLQGQNVGTYNISNIQIEEGETATEYTPYIDPATVTVRKSGKNIYKVTAKTQTVNGVTFTVNNDGSVKVHGTATKTTFIGLGTLHVKAGEKYYLSGSPSGSSFDTYMVYIHNNTTGADIYDLGNGKVFEGKDGDQGLVIVVYEGTTVNNLMFYPMVEYGENGGNFEPYTGMEYTPETDGSIKNFTSIYPNMTILTETDGIIVDCEYIKDSNKVIEKLINAIVALGGSV